MQMLKTTVNLPMGLVQEAKMYAVQNQTSFTQLLIKGLEHTLAEENQDTSSLSNFLDTFTPLPSLSEREREERYRKHLVQKYG